MANAKDASAKADEATDNVREFAEKGANQARQNVSHLQDAAVNAAGHIQEAATKSSKSYRELGLKSVEITRSNLNAHFDFLDSLLKAKSFGQAFEIQTAYARHQIEVLGGQAKELSDLAQKAAVEGAKPFQDLGNKTARSAQSAH